MKTVFSIGDANTGCDILLFEIGEGYCCYGLLKGEERKFHQIRYITYDVLEAEKKLAIVFEELKKENCDKVIVCSSFSQSLLIPNQYNGNNYSLLKAIHDLPFQKYFTDPVPEWQLNVVYALPESIIQLITGTFSSAQFFHLYNPMLKIYNGFVAPDQIDIHFNTEYFIVLFKKNKQVQLIQTYSYKTPLDVVYYLLKICYEFQIKQPEVFVIVSGLIDKDSNMYTELHNYFLNLHFAQAPSYSIPENDHPHHYFTSLYNLAACVS